MSNALHIPQFNFKIEYSRSFSEEKICEERWYRERGESAYIVLGIRPGSHYDVGNEGGQVNYDLTCLHQEM